MELLITYVSNSEEERRGNIKENVMIALGKFFQSKEKTVQILKGKRMKRVITVERNGDHEGKIKIRQK